MSIFIGIIVKRRKRCVDQKGHNSSIAANPNNLVIIKNPYLKGKRCDDSALDIHFSFGLLRWLKLAES